MLAGVKQNVKLHWSLPSVSISACMTRVNCISNIVVTKARKTQKKEAWNIWSTINVYMQTCTMHAIYSVICTMQVYLTITHQTVIHEKCLDLSNLDAKFKALKHIENPNIPCFPKLHPFASFEFFGYLIRYIRIRKIWMANSNWNTLTDPNTTHLLSHTEMRADFPRVWRSELGSSWSD